MKIMILQSTGAASITAILLQQLSFTANAFGGISHSPQLLKNHFHHLTPQEQHQSSSIITPTALFSTATDDASILEDLESPETLMDGWDSSKLTQELYKIVKDNDNLDTTNTELSSSDHTENIIVGNPTPSSKLSTIAQRAQDLLNQAEQWYQNNKQSDNDNVEVIAVPDDEAKLDAIRWLEQNDNHESVVEVEIVVGPVPDTTSYTIVMDAWSKAGRVDKVLNLLNQMKQLHLEEQEEAGIISANHELVEYWKRRIQPTTMSYNSVIHSFSIGQTAATSASTTNNNANTNPSINESVPAQATPLEAEKILNEMKQQYQSRQNIHCSPTTTSYNTILKVWANSGRKDAGDNAERILDEMWDIHYQYYQQGLDTIHDNDVPVEKDNNTFNENNSINDNANDYNQQKHGEDEEYDTTDTTATANINNRYSIITPDQFSYSTAITAWARSGLGIKAAKRAEQLLERMEEVKNESGYEHLQPTTYCVNAVLNAWAKAKTKESGTRAETILKRMEDLYLNDGRSELCPNTISYNTVISAYARSNQPGSARRAESFLRHMNDLSSNETTKEKFISCQPDGISYNTVINAWVRSRDPDSARRAEAILRHMERQYLAGHSDVVPDVFTYTSVINAWARSKDRNSAERAEAILHRMEDAYLERGNIAARPSVLSYNTVCNAWAKSSKDESADRAMDILNKMEDLYRQKGETFVKPDIFTYTSVIDALSKRGTRESAEKAAELLAMVEKLYVDTYDNSVKPNVRTYTSVINAISRSKIEPRRAEKVLNRMKILGENNSDFDLKPDVVCYNALINAWGWSKEPRKAKSANDVYEGMLDLFSSGENRGAKPDLISLNSVLNACAFANKRDEEERTESLDIAIKLYEFVQSSAPKYGVPNHITYGTMLMVINNLLPASAAREDLAKNVFWQCCEKGHLSGFIVSQLQKCISTETLKSLFGDAAVDCKNGRVRIEKHKVPREWSEKGRGGRKSRPSKKRRLTEVTKQQPR